MAKGPRMSNEMQQMITAVFRNHRDWRIKEIQAEVDRLTEGKAPGISAVQKLLSQIKSRETEPQFKSLDRLWSLGTLSEHPMPPEVIPKLLEIQGLDLRSQSKSRTLTIRQAQWVARLHMHQTDISLLYLTAMAYAIYEEDCELTRQQCDTSEFDAQLSDSMGAVTVFRMVFDRLLGKDWNKDERFIKLLEESRDNQP